MPITLNDLAQTPELCSRVIAGERGGNELVSWAHVCELPDPSEWLGKGDVLMTTGIGIPVDASQQVSYIQRLHAGGVAGMMIGDNMKAPACLDALIKEAESLGFPVLMTEYGVPFSAVTKAVMEAYKQLEYARRTAITKIYETARLSIQGIGLPQLLKSLGSDVGAVLHLVEPETLRPWMAGLRELPDSHREVLLLRPRSVRSPPVVQRCAVEGGETVLMSVPSYRGGLLAAHSAEALDYGLLHHIVAVIGIELERLKVERETRLRLGSELIDDLLHKRVLPRQAQSRLKASGADVEHLRMAVCEGAMISVKEIDQALVQQGFELIIRAQGEEVIFLCWDDVSLERLQSTLKVLIGVSDIFDYLDDFTNALREARLALAHAAASMPLSFYSDAGVSAPWLPQNLHDATEAFHKVLGELAEYDKTQHAPLIHTLRTFLENNRSWVNTALKLHIHKQTLVYRVRRIEDITGRSLDSTDDVSILWFALKAADLAGALAKCTSGSMASARDEKHYKAVG
ncbi:MAG: PucR family transcriptional regulator [Pseudomonas rhizophila]|uniref:PucR family transcriptional regulator n=1 Tax=Pseudomonas rhizophila TaxID=2045200 RepID=UPI003F6D082E